jgi:hypothetical protein
MVQKSHKIIVISEENYEFLRERFGSPAESFDEKITELLRIAKIGRAHV